MKKKTIFTLFSVIIFYIFATGYLYSEVYSDATDNIKKNIWIISAIWFIVIYIILTIFLYYRNRKEEKVFKKLNEFLKQKNAKIKLKYYRKLKCERIRLQIEYRYQVYTLEIKNRKISFGNVMVCDYSTYDNSFDVMEKIIELLDERIFSKSFSTEMNL